MIPGQERSAGDGIVYPLQYSWASLVAQTVQIPLQCGRPGFGPWVEKIAWRREQLPTPVFWIGEVHGQRSLACYSPWGRKESDPIERLTLSFLAAKMCQQPILVSPCLKHDGTIERGEQPGYEIRKSSFQARQNQLKGMADPHVCTPHHGSQLLFPWELSDAPVQQVWVWIPRIYFWKLSSDSYAWPNFENITLNELIRHSETVCSSAA